MTDVLIIGAGPSGLFAAGELARHGVSARLIERLPTPHLQSRATSVQPSTLEMFARIGLLESFIQNSVILRRAVVTDGSFRTLSSSTLDGMDTPYSFKCSLPQFKTEELLDQHLQSLGGSVERGVRAGSIELQDQGSRVVLEHSDGRREEVFARYVIGAGGAHSPVRGALHEHLEGKTYPLRYLVADIAGDIPFEPGCMAVIVSGNGIAFYAALPGNRGLVIVDRPDGPIQETPSREELLAALRLHLEKVPEISDIRWASYFHTHRRIAPKFGDGRRFLVGDAAHICSPFGGTGLNAGLHDAADIAWKLALVLKGWALPSLLDSYNEERIHVANQILSMTDAAHLGYYQMVSQMAAGEKNPHLPTNEKQISPSLLDVSLGESRLVGCHPAAGSTENTNSPGQRFRDRTLLRGKAHHLVTFKGKRNTDPDPRVFLRRWGRLIQVSDASSLRPDLPSRVGMDEGGAMLIRPDGYIGYRADPWNEAAMQALDSHLAVNFIKQEP